MTHPPAGPSNPTPPPGPKYGQTLTLSLTTWPTQPRPGGDPDPVTNPQNPRPKWAVACLIAAAVLTVGALLLWDIVTVPWAVVGGR